MKRLILSRGLVDHVAVLDGRLRLGGWVGAYEPLPFVGLRVEVGGRPCEVVEQMLQLESPDIEKGFSFLFRAGQSRFFVDVDVPDAEELRDLPILVVPLTPSGNPGCTMFQVVRPTVQMPEEEQVRAVGGDAYSGLEFMSYFLSLAGLSFTDDVLDIGCGLGRMAFPLAYYLAPGSRYIGFDVVPENVDLAAKRFGRRFANLQFAHADIKNLLYNPHGTVNPLTFSLPSESRTSGFVCATSVFTHMRGNEVKHYLDEIARVLRPDGSALITCFLLNRESRDLMARGRSDHNFSFDCEDCFTQDASMPEAAVAYDEHKLASWLTRVGLTASDVFYGSWCGRTPSLSYQDILILRHRS